MPGRWLKDMRLAGGGARPSVLLPVSVALIAGILLLAVVLFQGRGNAREVIVYTSQDQVYSEPILREFERHSGIRVRAVYDSEAVKTVGLANRLLAEKSSPRCDVFWSNEELRTRQLDAQGVFERWVAVGHRSRRIAINTNLLSVATAPHSLAVLTNATWRGKVALAYPLFGTTATHFLALRQHWGDDPWLAWCRALAANRPFLVDGNSVVARLVARGEAWVGLTDSDDIAAEQREGAPIAALPLDEESLLIPNTLAIVRGAPNPASAEELVEYLERSGVLEKMVAARALESALPEAAGAKALQPDWDEMLRELGTATESLKGIFLR